MGAGIRNGARWRLWFIPILLAGAYVCAEEEHNPATQPAKGSVGGWGATVREQASRAKHARGTGNGNYPTAYPPIRWRPEHNLLWTCRLPEGLVVFGASIACLDAGTGKPRWQARLPDAAAVGDPDDGGRAPRRGGGHSDEECACACCDCLASRRGFAH